MQGVITQQRRNLSIEVELIPPAGRFPGGRFPVKDEQTSAIHARVPGNKVAMRDSALDGPAVQLSFCPSECRLTQRAPVGVEQCVGLVPASSDFFKQDSALPDKLMNVPQAAQEIFMKTVVLHRPPRHRTRG